jgi:hypothetical protein
MEPISPTSWRERAVAAVAAAALAAAFIAAITGFVPTRAGEPERSTEEPLCCGVPPAGEVRADHVFGRWVVMRAGIGAPVRAGDQMEFLADGTVKIGNRLCRYAVLRAELSLSCADEVPTAKTESEGRPPSAVRGDLRFVDDTKLIWRLDAKSSVHIAPAD